MRTFELPCTNRSRFIRLEAKLASENGGFGRPGHPSEFQRRWKVGFTDGTYLTTVYENFDKGGSGTSTFTTFPPSHKPIGLSLYDMERFDVQETHPDMDSALDALRRLYYRVCDRADRFRHHLNERLAATRKAYGDQIAMGDTCGFVLATVWDYHDDEQDTTRCAHIRMLLDPRDAIAGLLTDGICVDIHGCIVSDGMESFFTFGKWTGSRRGDQMTMYRRTT